jgi:hypothetical protein
LRNKCWNDEIVVETDFTKKQSKRELNLADVKESMRKRGFMNYDEQTNSNNGAIKVEVFTGLPNEPNTKS